MAQEAAAPGRTSAGRVPRNPAVDTLRGIACILLVLVHVIGYDETSGIRVSDDSFFRWFGDSAIYLRMPLFSFVAGLVYAWRPVDRVSTYPLFMRKKVRRLLVPYVIFVPVIGLVQTFLPGANNPPGGNLLTWLLYSISPYWFLLSTFWIFAVVALLDGAGVLRRPWVVALVAATLVAVNLLLPADGLDLLQIGNTLSLAPFFVIGLATARFRLDQMPRWLLVGLAAVFVALLAYTQLGIFGVVDAVDSRRHLVGLAVGTLFPLVFLALGWKNRALAWIGAYSSGIFLLHSFAIGAGRFALQRLGVTADGLLVVLLGAAGIFASILGVVVLRRFALGRIVLGEKV